jgi:hypothetical protein
MLHHRESVQRGNPSFDSLVKLMESTYLSLFRTSWSWSFAAVPHSTRAEI